jgi:hypothetical protein
VRRLFWRLVRRFEVAFEVLVVGLQSGLLGVVWIVLIHARLFLSLNITT